MLALGRVWVRFLGADAKVRGGVRHGVDICQASFGSYIDLTSTPGHAGSPTAPGRRPSGGRAAPGAAPTTVTQMVYQPEASAAAAARRRRSQRRVGFADQPPPSPDATFPPPALEIDEDETDAVSALDGDGPLRAPDGEQLEIQIDAVQTPKVSKQHIAFGRVVRERQAVDAYVAPPKSLTLDPDTGAPVFRSPASKKKYGWTRTPKQTPTKVRRKVKRVMDSLPPPPSVTKYVDRAPDEESVIRPSDFESFGSPPPKAPPVFLTEPDEPRSPLSPVENTFPTGTTAGAVEAVRAKKERLQREMVEAKREKADQRKLRFVREKRWKKWLVLVVSGRAAMELANRFLLKCIQEEDARLHEDAQRTLARFYRSITRRRRLHAAATLLKARSLNVTIQLRVWKKRFASRKLQRFLKETVLCGVLLFASIVARLRAERHRPSTPSTRPSKRRPGPSASAPPAENIFGRSGYFKRSSATTERARGLEN